MNRRELLKAIPGIPGMYVNGRLALKAGLLAKRAPTRGPRQPGKVIAQQLVMHRTHLLELLTAPGWMAGSRTSKDSSFADRMAAHHERSAAEAEAQDFIYLVVQPILDPKCPNCHKLWGYHSDAERPECFNALCTVKKYGKPRPE